MIVADTNLIAYLLLEGPRTADARAACRRDPDWAAPPLWRSEFRNVLAGYVRRDELRLEEAIERFLDAQEVLSNREIPVSTGAVLDLVSRSRCTAYDCEFVALAQAQAVPLVTSDADVLRAFPGIAVSLEEFALG